MSRNQTILFIILCSIILFICLFGLLGDQFLSILLKRYEYQKLGNDYSIDKIGDGYAIINTFFSGLAFLALVFTIILQTRQIRQQGREIRLQITESKNQVKEFAQQNFTMRLQQFENTFFQLLKLHNELVSNATYDQMYIDPLNREDDHQIHIKGKQIIKWMIDDDYMKDTKPRNFRYIEKRYREFYSKYDFFLGHYFRLLYRIILMVDRTNFFLKGDSKSIDIINYIPNEYRSRIKNLGQANYVMRYHYTSMVRAHFSDPEIQLIYLNGLFSHGSNFKPLIEKYALLDNIRLKKTLIERSEYKDTAFRNPLNIKHSVGG